MFEYFGNPYAIESYSQKQNKRIKGNKADEEVVSENWA